MVEGFNIVQFLKSAVATGASDEHLKVGSSPYIRVNGFIKKTNLPILTKEALDSAIIEIANCSQIDNILKENDIDFMFEIKGCSRFRINYNRQLGMPALVIRNLSYKIPTIEELNLPECLDDLAIQHNGIILLTGPTGSGKSTTLASMINKILTSSSKHIITIEDPVEYVFNSNRSIVSQRQVGVDTESFASGIKYALRQDPDVIFIGEIRDKETMSAALKAAETGHLVFSTLHTNDAVQTINRIVNMFEESNRELIRRQLAETLRTTIAQTLVYSEKNNCRYPACEIMNVSSTIRDYILKDNTEDIYRLIKENNVDNSISLNMSLFKLVKADLITEEEALKASTDSNELEKMLRGASQGSKAFYEQ